MRAFLFAALLATLALSRVTLTEAWSASRVRYVDSSTTGSNWLFRGSEPVVGGKFIYDELVSTIRTVAQRDANLTLPATIRLIGTLFIPHIFFLWQACRIIFVGANVL
jgi:hypothetical protein